MQFQVPQFIEVEDKIFGPFTFRQFVWMAGGLGISYILYRIFPVFLAIPLAISVVGLAAALAFAQVNGRSFIIWLESAFYYFIHPRLYLWSNVRPAKPIAPSELERTLTNDPTLYVPKLTESKIHDLAWSLDIKERIASGSSSDDDRALGGGVFALRTARDALGPGARKPTE
jgi:hypothetical protein